MAARTQTAGPSRVPIGEVIVEFADGGSYTKSKMEQQVLAIEERRVKKMQAKKQQEDVNGNGNGQGAASEGVVKEEDLVYLTSQFPIPASSATYVLSKTNGDLQKAIEEIVQTRGIPGEGKKGEI